MDFKVQHLIGGDGDMQKHIPFTIDFKPILVTLKYNLEKHSIPDPFSGEKMDFKTSPNYINKIYHKENFQELLDIVTNTLGIEKRFVECEKKNNKRDTYAWTKYNEVKEYLYEGGFDYVYHLKTKLRHALYFHDNFRETLKYSEMFNSYDNDDKKQIEIQFGNHFSKVKEYLYMQGVLHGKKDITELSNHTINNFIKNLKVK